MAGHESTKQRVTKYTQSETFHLIFENRDGFDLFIRLTLLVVLVYVCLPSVVVYRFTSTHVRRQRSIIRI